MRGYSLETKLIVYSIKKLCCRCKDFLCCHDSMWLQLDWFFSWSIQYMNFFYGLVFIDEFFRHNWW